MQTRRQARQAAELVAAAQAVVQSTSHPSHSHSVSQTPSLVWAPSFASTLSDLTPSSSFTSDGGDEPTMMNLHSIAEGEDTEDEDADEGPAAATAARHFGVPQFAPRNRRSLRTPVQSHGQSHFGAYPAEVFETPRKHTRAGVPLEAQQRAARVARDSEIARSGGLAQLTRGGTLLVTPHESETETEQDWGRGEGLASAFGSPQVQKRTTAAPSKAAKTLKTPPLEATKTRVVNQTTGQLQDRRS